MDASSLGLVQLGATALVNVGLAILAGCIGSLWMLRRDRSAWARLRAASTNNVLQATAAGFLVADGVLLWTHAAVMTEQPLLTAARSIGHVALTTHVGRAGVLGAAAASILIVAAFLARSQSLRHLLLVGVCFAVLTACKSWASHAGATGMLVPAVVDWLHVLSVSTWSGIVFLAAYLVLRRPEPADLLERSDCANAVQALSNIATWSLGGVLVTGALSAWRTLGGSLDPLRTSIYGGTLLLKLVLVGIAVALGAHNRLAVMPRLLVSLRTDRNLSSPSLLRTFHDVLVWESLVFVAVLSASAVLGTAVPPDTH